MALINWSSDMSVSVKDMDSQHQVLVDMINKLHEAMLAGKGGQEINLIVDRMVDYTQRHFKAEENILQAQQYPKYVQQKKEHDAFVLKVLEFKRDLQSGKIGLSVQVSNFLKDWLTHHIMVEDKQYGKYLNSKGIL